MRQLRIAMAAGVLIAVSGCSQFQPWVKPYERERLADRVMAWDRDPLSASYIEHVHGNREDAKGGTGSTGGGCGCN